MRGDESRPILVRVFEVLFYEVPGTTGMNNSFSDPETQSEENQYLINRKQNKKIVLEIEFIFYFLYTSTGRRKQHVSAA